MYNCKLLLQEVSNIILKYESFFKVLKSTCFICLCCNKYPNYIPNIVATISRNKFCYYYSTPNYFITVLFKIVSFIHFTLHENSICIWVAYIICQLHCPSYKIDANCYITLCYKIIFQLHCYLSISLLAVVTQFSSAYIILRTALILLCGNVCVVDQYIT